MSLLRTHNVRVGAVLAFTADATEINGVAIMWGNPDRMGLSRGDMIQVLEFETRPGTMWAKVLILILRGKHAGRTGHVSVDMGRRSQRCWRAITASGSMAAVREPSSSRPSRRPTAAPRASSKR